MSDKRCETCKWWSRESWRGQDKGLCGLPVPLRYPDAAPENYLSLSDTYQPTLASDSCPEWEPREAADD